jgi:hypothetical protein
MAFKAFVALFLDHFLSLALRSSEMAFKAFVALFLDHFLSLALRSSEKVIG